MVTPPKVPAHQGELNSNNIEPLQKFRIKSQFPPKSAYGMTIAKAQSSDTEELKNSLSPRVNSMSLSHVSVEQAGNSFAYAPKNTPSNVVFRNVLQ
ncbi:hypothetical protein EVAR_84986_1 [Eumeta japonica]|uniref:Uncharacterized protein n=1 Tax=Eumeta variegata TaxID=151549 RepID=A0A4C1WB72_EUMVA|nr:hypothetical protein EVAR_84986_1 [Eumeta japonica]